MTSSNDLRVIIPAAKPSDAEICRMWRMAESLARPSIAYRSALDPIPHSPSLGQRLAAGIADDLESRGVTEADIDRLGLA